MTESSVTPFISKPGAIRDQFPSLSHWHHFNCGGIAPLSNAVGAELLRLPQTVIAEGPAALLNHDDAVLGVENARATIARLINADPDEIAFTTQFSSAVNIVFEGLDWRDDDEVIITDQEHPAMLIPLMNIAQRRGVQVRYVPWSHDPEAMLDSFRQVLNERTRMVAMSHVTTETGAVLPAEEMTRLAQEQGALVLWDGAQSAGQIPVDVRQLRCEFYTMVGFKWLLGPFSSAVLYIRRDMLDKIGVTWTGSNTTVRSGPEMGPDDLVWLPSARRYEYGGRAYSYDTAMACGASWVMEMGVENILAHSRSLTAYFHEGLGHIPTATVLSPNAEQATGIATITLEGFDGQTLSRALWDRYRIIQRAAHENRAVRVSLSAFIEERDVDYLLECLAELATEQCARNQ